MRDRDYEPPAPDQTLRQWMASTSADWMESQPTLWLPAVRDDPAVRTGPEPRAPSIPRQRARASTRRLTQVPADRGTEPEPAGDPTGRRFAQPVLVSALLVAAVLLAVATLLALGLV